LFQLTSTRQPGCRTSEWGSSGPGRRGRAEVAPAGWCAPPCASGRAACPTEPPVSTPPLPPGRQAKMTAHQFLDSSDKHLQGLLPEVGAGRSLCSGCRRLTPCGGRGTIGSAAVAGDDTGRRGIVLDAARRLLAPAGEKVLLLALAEHVGALQHPCGPRACCAASGVVGQRSSSVAGKTLMFCEKGSKLWIHLMYYVSPYWDHMYIFHAIFHCIVQ